MLDQGRLPAGDRARLGDMRRAVDAAIASDQPMFRSFEARAVLRETIALLGRHGVRLDDSAIVNFDTIEADVPTAAKAKIARFSFVRSTGEPKRLQPAAVPHDSEARGIIRSTLANMHGVTGTGVKVAIVDEGYKCLSAAVAASELISIPAANQRSVAPAGGPSSVTTVALDAPCTFGVGGNPATEHGTAMAEVVFEVAPAAQLLLYRVSTAKGVERAIRHASDQGAKVILVALSAIRTMGNGTNDYTDDVTYAKATGAAVVVAAGDDALRHYSATFTPCSSLPPSDQCGGLSLPPNDANNTFHLFDVEDPYSVLASFLAFEDGIFDLTCTSGVESLPGLLGTDYDFRLYEDACEASFPTEFAQPLRNVGLGQEFTAEVDTENKCYYLAVKRTREAAPIPRFRINCWNPITDFDYATPEGSLSDLATITDTIAVGALDFFSDPELTFIADYSSIGPSGLAGGPVKPDLVGPADVGNWTIHQNPAPLSFSEELTGSSTAAAHTAGVVALMQSKRLLIGQSLLTPDQVKQQLIQAAVDLSDSGVPDGPDFIYGNGRLNVPDSAITSTVCGNGVIEAAGGEQCEPGPQNPCCSGACQFLPSTTVCRPSAGVCDLSDKCTGASATCPADAKSAAPCRAANGGCDVAESCNGVGNTCPADGFRPQGFVCRDGPGGCDPDEVCGGSSAACPANTPPPVACGNGCKQASEECDGSNTGCSGGEPVCDLETCTCMPDDLIFSDSFESGDLSAWDFTSTDNGDAAASSAAALVGNMGLGLTINDATRIWVHDESPNAETHYRVRFYIDPNDLVSPELLRFKILTAASLTPVKRLFQMVFRVKAGNYQVFVRNTQENLKPAAKTPWLDIPNAPTSIEVEWRKASSAVANDGVCRIWINGVLQANLSNIDTFTNGIDYVRWGALVGITQQVSGTLRLDHFESRSVNPIGP